MTYAKSKEESAWCLFKCKFGIDTSLFAFFLIFSVFRSLKRTFEHYGLDESAPVVN